MSMEFPWLIAGIVLLWFPRKWMRRGAAFFRRRRRETEPWNVNERGDSRLSFRAEFSKFRNYVDFLRAGIGSLLLMGRSGLSPALQAEPGPSSANVAAVLGIQSAILLVGVLVQTLRREKGHVSFYPPVFYLAGISMGLCDMRGAVFAFSLAWAMNAALPGARAFLAVYALLVLAFGLLFAGVGDKAVIVSSVLTFLPVLLSLLFKRSLAVLARKPKGARGHA
jgi:hypothetical protein